MQTVASTPRATVVVLTPDDVRSKMCAAVAALKAKLATPEFAAVVEEAMNWRLDAPERALYDEVEELSFLAHLPRPSCCWGHDVELTDRWVEAVEKLCLPGSTLPT